MAPTEATNGVLIIRSRSIAAGFHLEKDAHELAHRLGIRDDKVRLNATVNMYREACHRGRDDEFGRSPRTLIEFQGELYGLPLWPCLLNTQGGPKRNSRGQILNVWENPSSGSIVPASSDRSGDFCTKAVAISVNASAWDGWREPMRRRKVFYRHEPEVFCPTVRRRVPIPSYPLTPDLSFT